jgi:hypothetical protein
MAMVHVKKEVRPELFLNHLVEGAVACCRETVGPLGDESALRRRLVGRFHDIFGEDLEIGEDCGLSILCQENNLVGLWSEAGQAALKEEYAQEKIP